MRPLHCYCFPPASAPVRAPQTACACKSLSLYRVEQNRRERAAPVTSPLPVFFFAYHSSHKHIRPSSSSSVGICISRVDRVRDKATNKDRTCTVNSVNLYARRSCTLAQMMFPCCSSAADSSSSRVSSPGCS